MNGPKDSLEDFFHQSYKDSEVVNQAGDWNLPSDGVWEGIQEGMTEERKLSFVFLKWPWSAIAASYLLIMGGYQFMEKYKEQAALASMVLTEELVLKNGSLAEVSITDEFIHSTKKEQAINLTKETNISTNERASRTPSSGSSKLVIKQQEQVSDYIDNNRFYTKVEVLDRSDFQKSNISLSVKENVVQGAGNQLIIKNKVPLKLPNKDIVEKLTTTNIHNLVSLDAKTPTIPLSNITKPVKKPSNIYISASYSTISEDLKQENLSQEQADQLMANVKNSKGKKVGLDIGWTNQKGWGIETGINYTNLTRETVVNQEIPAQVLQANMNANAISNVDLVWNDVDGSKEVGLNVNNRASIGTGLAIELTQNTKNHFIEVPLVVRKKWSIGKLDFGVKTGLINQFAISKSFEDPSITLEDNSFEVLANDFRRNGTVENNKYTPQLIAGISLEYFIQPNLSVYVEPTFSKSLRPVIDFSFANIHSQNKAVTMGMRYHL